MTGKIINNHTNLIIAMTAQNKDHLVTFYYCTKTSSAHPKKHHGSQSDEFRLTTLEVGTYYDHWLRATYPLKTLHRFCTSGFTVIPSDFDGDRIEDGGKGSGFISSNCIFLDNDDAPIGNVKDSLESVGLHLNAYYDSTSNTPESPRNRAIITIDEPITDLVIFKKVLSFLIDLTGTDRQCRDSLRLYYPGTGGSILTDKPNNTATIVELAIQHDEAKNERISIATKTGLETLNNDGLVALIDNANVLCDSHPWRRLVCDNEWLYHDDLFTIATSLLRMEGGLEFLEEYIESQPYKPSDCRRKLKWLKDISTKYAPRMFTNGNRLIDGINGYSLYYLSKMFLSNKEEGLVEEESPQTSSEVSETLTNHKDDSKNNLEAIRSKALVDSDTENGGLIYSYKSQKSVSEPAQDIPGKGFSDSIGINDATADTTTDDCDSSSTKTFLPKYNMDVDGNVYRTLTDEELKARLETIKTARTADYETLMEIDLFSRFVEGDRLDGIGTDEYNQEHTEHKALVFGLCALCQYIEMPNGETTRFGQFLNDVAFSHAFYDRKKRAKKTILMPKIIKDVEGTKASNKKRVGINKVIPKSYHNEHKQTTLYLEYKEYKQIEQSEVVLKPKYKYATKEENREWLFNPDKNLFKQSKGNVRVLEACTGLGKGVLLIDWIKEGKARVLLSKMAVAVPTHELLDETVQRWIDSGLEYGTDFISTPNVQTLPESILLRIQPLYAIGLYTEAKHIIQDSDSVEAKEYLEKEAIAKDFPGLILTTHTKLVNDLSQSNEWIEGLFDDRPYVVIDECPSDCLIDVQEMPLSDIQSVLRILRATQSDDTEMTIYQLEEVVSICKSMLNDYANELANNSRVNKALYSELGIKLSEADTLHEAVSLLKDSIDSKVIDLLSKEYAVYKGVKDHFLFGTLKTLQTRNTHITILSATPYLPIIKACFGANNVSHEQSTLTELLAQLYMVKANKTSRSGMRQDVNTKGILSDDWADTVRNIPSETLAVCKEFKKQVNELKSTFSSVVLTYPSAGLNAVMGKSLTAIGKYLESEQSLLMKAILIGAKPTTVARNNFRLQTRDFIPYTTYTFVDETLRELDIISHERAMLQTIGRARLLDYAITVFFISDRALPLSTEITYDEFIHKVHISATDNSATMSYRFTSTENSLFIEQYLGLRDGKGELTAFGADLLNKFNNNSSAMLQYVVSSYNKGQTSIQLGKKLNEDSKAKNKETVK